MPKRKTNKAILKRVKITKRKKVLIQKTKRRHLLGDRDANLKRGLRGWHRVDETRRKSLLKGLPYGAR